MAEVTEQQLRAIYAMLREFPPFKRWKLPEPAAVSFGILKDANAQAQFSTNKNGKPKIEVNPDFNLTLLQMIEAVAHEMVHVHQDRLGKLPNNPARHHNAQFRRLARQAASRLSFDIQRF